jgi:hypothetical protein
MENSPVVSLLDSGSVLKVSSTLEKATGKKHLIDGSLEACWTSQQVSKHPKNPSSKSDYPELLLGPTTICPNQFP